jgi:hypothetical protein
LAVSRDSEQENDGDLEAIIELAEGVGKMRAEVSRASSDTAKRARAVGRAGRQAMASLTLEALQGQMLAG